MKFYRIGEVAEILGITTYTLRYYEKERLLPRIRKNSAGLRCFTPEDLNWLQILECLKSTGLPLKEIRHYLELSQKGDATLNERLQIFQKQKNRLEKQISDLQVNMEKINFKIKYYEQALQKGEKNVYSNNQAFAKERDRLFKKIS